MVWLKRIKCSICQLRFVFFGIKHLKIDSFSRSMFLFFLYTSFIFARLLSYRSMLSRYRTKYHYVRYYLHVQYAIRYRYFQFQMYKNIFLTTLHLAINHFFFTKFQTASRVFMKNNKIKEKRKRTSLTLIFSTISLEDFFSYSFWHSPLFSIFYWLLIH